MSAHLVWNDQVGTSRRVHNRAVASGWITLVLISPIAIAGCGPGGVARPGEMFDAGPVFSYLTPDLRHTFHVRNTTGRPVQIVGEHHSCSCTEIRLTKGRLEPGQSTTLEMIAHVPSTYSRTSLSCTILTDDPKFNEWTYGLTFESLPRAAIAANRVELSMERSGQSPGGNGEPPRRLSAETWFEAFAPAGANLPKPTAVSAADGLAVEIDKEPQVDQLGGGVRRARYRVHLTTVIGEQGGLTGTQSFPVTIRATDGIVTATTAVWTFHTSIESLPSRVHFGMVKGGAPEIHRKIAVRSVDGRPFRIVSAAGGDHGLVRLTGGALPTSPAVSHTLELTLSASETEQQSRAASGIVRLRTDRGPFYEVHVPWSVFFQRPGRTEGLRPVSTGAANLEREVRR